MSINKTKTGKYVRVNGLHMYYEKNGAGTPVILIHGGAETCRMWDPFLDLFSSDYQLITPDSRAHGRTDNPSGQYRYPLMAEDMAQFIQALELKRPFVAGYSDGGQVALEMAMNYPGLARGYLIGAVYYRLTEAWRDFMQTQLCMVGPGVVDIGRMIKTHPEFVEVLQERHDAFHTPGYWQTFLVQLSTQWMSPLDYTPEDFSRIVDPMLFFCGDRDVFCPPEQNLELYRMVNRADLAVVLDADHFTIANQFHLVVPIMENFMNRNLLTNR